MRLAAAGSQERAARLLQPKSTQAGARDLPILGVHSRSPTKSLLARLSVHLLWIGMRLVFVQFLHRARLKARRSILSAAWNAAVLRAVMLRSLRSSHRTGLACRRMGRIGLRVCLIGMCLDFLQSFRVRRAQLTTRHLMPTASVYTAGLRILRASNQTIRHQPSLIRLRRIGPFHLIGVQQQCLNFRQRVRALQIARCLFSATLQLVPHTTI